MTAQETLRLLQQHESRNVTFVEPDGSWPIVWERARGVHVWDAAGRKYLDLTAAFGVASAGHANPRVVRAGQRQMARLLHAMGDVHPHALKAELARELSRLTFERWAGAKLLAPPAVVPIDSVPGNEGRFSLTPALSRRERERRSQRSAESSAGGLVESRTAILPLLWGEGRGEGAGHGQSDAALSLGAPASRRHFTGKTIFCNSGFEAVEAALKTALLATGRRGVIAFQGAYHGLGYGALNATHRALFRAPFKSQLAEFGSFVTFPTEAAQFDAVETQVRRAFRKSRIGAVLVEPVQGRGGIVIPPPGFLSLLRRLCDEHGALLIADEIFTGFGRTGKWFACEHEGVMPDVICLGKALTGGFPLSACVGRAEVMDAAWPVSAGEAIHTSTFLGHPVGCAMALAQIAELRRLKLIERSARLGKSLLTALSKVQSPKSKVICRARGLGLMAGLELTRADGSPATAEALRCVKAMLHRGFILLPEGEHSSVIGFTPPLTITEAQLTTAVVALGRVFAGPPKASGHPSPHPSPLLRGGERVPGGRVRGGRSGVGAACMAGTSSS